MSYVVWCGVVWTGLYEALGHMSRVRRVMKDPGSRDGPLSPCRPQVGTLSPATHAFTFWVGMTKAAKMAIGRLWNNCPSLKVSSRVVV